MPFPTPRIRHFVSLSALAFLQRRVQSFRPPLEHLPHQFQKNAYHFDKDLIRIPGFVPLSVLAFLPPRAPSVCPLLEQLPHQLLKNAYHFDKDSWLCASQRPGVLATEGSICLPTAI